MGSNRLLEAQAWLESNQEQMVKDLIELANQNSGSSNVDGLISVASWLADWCNFHPAKFQRIHLPARRTIGDDGKELIQETGPALRWDYRPDSRQRVLFAIHYDTVYGIDHSFQTCHRHDSDKLQGPGVADAKGGIIVLRYAIKALMEFSLLHDCGWTVLLNPDEEVGSPSSNKVFSEMARDFDFGLLFEPCLPTGELVSHRKGSGNFCVVVRGRSAHAGRDFFHGRNAVAKLCWLLTQLDQLNGQREGLTINIGNLRGGGPVNVVPDLAIGRFNVRLVDSEGEKWFEDHLRSLVAEVNRCEGYQCEVHGSISSPAKLVTPESQQLMLAIEACGSELGQPIHWKGTGGVCDGNKLAAAGLTNVDTMGPMGDGLHSPNEWVLVSSLVAKAKLVVELISRFAAGGLGSLERQKFDSES